MIKTYNESPEDLSFTKKLGRISTSDLLSTVQASYLLKNRLVAGRYNRAKNAQTDVVSIPESKKIIVNGKSYDVTDEIDTKLSYKLKGEDRTKARRDNLKKELEAKLPESDHKKADIEEILGDEKSIPKIKYEHKAAQEGARTLRSEVANVYSDEYRNIKHHKLAKKAIERGITNPGQFWKYWGKRKTIANTTPKPEVKKPLTLNPANTTPVSKSKFTSPETNITPRDIVTPVSKPKEVLPTKLVRPEKPLLMLNPGKPKVLIPNP